MRTRSTRRRRARRGLLLMEALTGVVLIAAIATMLITTLAKQSRAAARLADDRAAIRRAEATLAAMNGRGPSTRPADVVIRRLDAPAATGWAWYEASAATGPRRVTLVGLAPADAAIGGAR